MSEMKLYLLKRMGKIDFDQFDSCVVVAEDENEARWMHPYGLDYEFIEDRWYKISKDGSGYKTLSRLSDDPWVSPDKVIVKLLGKVQGNGMDKQVVCSSFNAG